MFIHNLNMNENVMEKNIVTIGLLMVSLALLPLASAQAFQFKDLQSGSVSINAQMERADDSLQFTPNYTSFIIKNIVFNFSNAKPSYTFEQYQAFLSPSLFTIDGSFLSEDQVFNRTFDETLKGFDQKVELNLHMDSDYPKVEKASGVTKYTWEGEVPAVIKFGTYDRAEWGVNGDLIVLDNGSATLKLASLKS